MKMRAAGLTFLSLALTTAVIGNAYYHKKQFYPSVVYITKSNPSMAVIYLQAFVMVYLTGKLMRKVFFGELRAAEFEHLMERSWYAVTETCLAFTVFRDDFSPKFVALFTLLLFLKSFHWLAEDRVDFMERSPIISLLFHLRVLSLLVLLGALDIMFIDHAYQSTMTKGASVQLVFGFEYAILGTIIINIAIKYCLHTVDLHSETPWENKAVFLLYTELVMGFFKVILYMTFVAIMIRLYTLPLFAFRPMYYTMRKFKQAYNDVILSRRAIQNMNTLYHDATAEELAAADNVCIICREEMTTASKKLPCNHIFHTACLRSWFQRQQTCPTCRLNILRTPTPPAPQPPQVPPPRPFPFWQQPPAPPAGAAPQAGPSAATDPRPPPRFMTPIPPTFMMGMFPPPPMPPPDFSGLSDEELARMEGETRENIEARLQCLRQIELLLSASATVMAQYLAVAPTPIRNMGPGSQGPSNSGMNSGVATGPESANATVVNGAGEASPSGAPSQAKSSAPSPSNAGKEEEVSNSPAPPSPSPSNAPPPPSPSPSNAPPPPSPASSPSAGSSLEPSPPTGGVQISPSCSSSGSEASGSDATTSQQEELRRLRLQKFQQE